MTAVTKHALRVYSALDTLKEGNSDVLEALIPFFYPVLEVMDGRIFDPALFSLGVKRLYRWRFTRDIAQQFVPRLLKRGLLQRAASSDGEAVYVVKIDKIPSPEGDISILGVFEEIIDLFILFPPKLTDILHYTRTRDELKDILIRFLVSMDSPQERVLSTQIGLVQADASSQEILDRLEEGGRPLGQDDRYMCARFVRYLLRDKPKYTRYLSRLASIALLTEVVEDFLKPTNAEDKSDLTIALDAPLALDLPGCSGNAFKEDLEPIFNALKRIGCKFIVFDVSCLEMKRNLESMLSLPHQKRHGPTHIAIVRNEVGTDFIRAVANHPEKALQRIGVTARPLGLDNLPSTHRYFDQKVYEDFFQEITWVPDILPREHDATCTALIMRLREGTKSSDLFKCRFAMASRNMRFVRTAKEYCIKSGKMHAVQEGPIVSLKELATVAWLRTGLGADESIPRGHLIATCERVLHIRPEVKKALASQIERLTPERLEQFELLMLDSRSMQKLADETLNDSDAVTPENAERLLDVIRDATAEEHKQRYSEIIAKLQENSKSEINKIQQTLEAASIELLASKERAADAERAVEKQVDATVARLNGHARFAEFAVATIALMILCLGVYDFFTHKIASFTLWKGLSALVALYGAYRVIYALLERPTRGLASVLNLYLKNASAKALAHFEAETITKAGLQVSKGRISRKTSG